MFLERNQAPPPIEDIIPRVRAERAEHRLRLEDIGEAHEVAFGLRSSWLYRQRLNLSAADHRLVDGDVAAHRVPPPPGGPFASAWRNYLQQVFKKGYMYTISLSLSTFMYIAENKIVAGTEQRVYDG